MELDKDKLEIRQIEIRNTTDRIIEGTAIVFNSLSNDLGGFVEEILPEACTPEFLDSQDIVMLYNHNNNQVVLARSKYGKGTLKYTVDSQGVNFQFTAKDTALGNEVLAAVRAGDVDACSFAFRVDENGEKWENMGNGSYKRQISKFKVIRDFSVVPFPAYSETSVNTRGLDDLRHQEQEQQKLEELRQQEQLQEQRKAELDNYYSKYDSIISKYSN